jgi:TDG/mug DNA glycosylase family protein
VNGDVLPDLLRPGLRLVFCGTAAGTASARAKAYYAGPGNYFWPVLHEVGLTPVRLAPEEFRRLPEFGLGLTDACKRRFGSDAEVGTTDHDPERVRCSIVAVKPAHLAFVGKQAAKIVLNRPVDYGLQPDRFGGAHTWVLPSTSGLARRFWSLEPWQELSAAIRQGAVSPMPA